MTGTSELVGNLEANFFDSVDKSVEITFYEDAHKAFRSSGSEYQCKGLAGDLGNHTTKLEEEAGVSPFFSID